MLTAVIFDFDGTLIDSTDSMWNEFQRVAKILGLASVQFSQFTRQLGKPWANVITGLWPEADVDRFSSIYRKNRENVFPIDGVGSTLDELSKSYELGILTSRGKKTLYAYLKLVQIKPEIFDVILPKESIVKYKPDPAALTQMCESMNVRLNEAVYVGDSIVDLECSLRAKVPFIGVLTGGTTRNMFESQGAVEIIDSIVELPDLLNSIR